MSYLINETWTWDGVAPCPGNYTITHGREYRYDGGRQRYLNRELDPVELIQGDLVALNDTWTDYDGDEPYGDFTVQSGDPVDARSFELGLATVDPWTPSDGITTSYYHTDLIGTTRWMTDSSGNPASSATYTAFGERVDGTNQRYGYAGAWGYQSHGEFPYMHVGARYYDPATGRFLQRDPIGIAGGLNVYAYVDSNPLKYVDPSGLQHVTGPPPPPGPQPTPTDGDAGDIDVTVEVEVGVKGKTPEAKVKFKFDGKLKDFGDFFRKAIDAANTCVAIFAGTVTEVAKEVVPVVNPCFVQGTLVSTDQGQMRIESLEVGAVVLGRQGDSEDVAPRTVENVHRGWARDLILIELRAETIQCTPRHPFWVVDCGWVIAGKLAPGDTLLGAEGDVVVVVDIRLETQTHPFPVYNLTVDGSHTYFVGESRVLVHNKVLLP